LEVVELPPTFHDISTRWNGTALIAPPTTRLKSLTEGGKIMKLYLRKSLIVAVQAALVLACTAGEAVRAQQQPATSPAGPTLYAKIGGYDFVARFVDTAFPRVASHPQLRRLFQGHSRDSQMRQRQLIVDALCQAFGGPCLYIGRPMKPLHAGLGITSADWTTFVGIISSTLDELKVPSTEKKEFLTTLERRFRADVIDTP
jgi:hemoglobin